MSRTDGATPFGSTLPVKRDPRATAAAVAMVVILLVFLPLLPLVAFVIFLVRSREYVPAVLEHGERVWKRLRGAL